MQHVFHINIYRFCFIWNLLNPYQSSFTKNIYYFFYYKISFHCSKEKERKRRRKNKNIKFLKLKYVFVKICLWVCLSKCILCELGVFLYCGWYLLICVRMCCGIGICLIFTLLRFFKFLNSRLLGFCILGK